MTKKDIFDYRDYKAYLQAYIDSKPKGGRGVRLALANHIGSPVSHISQIFNGKSQLSLEQAEGVNEFVGHTDDEAQFFLLLVQKGRAGTPALKKRLDLQIQQIIERRLLLKDRLGVKQPLTKEAQATFYSSWLYGAIHVMLTIPKFQNKESISKHLGLSVKRVNEILQFLVSVGLAVQKENGRFDVGTARIHLGSESDLISKFHTNWRMKAIQSLESENANLDLHYSSAVTISEADFLKIKSLLVKSIEETKTIIKDSPAESVFSFCIDMFRI